jgi:alpha-1,2-mannosyltransferase
MSDERAIESPLERLGAFFDQKRLLTYATLLLIAEIAMAAYFVAASYNLFHTQTQPVTTDFVSFYAAGSLVDAGTPALVYHQPEHFAAEQQAREPGIAYNYFFYPPVFLMICALLAHLPYVPAFLVFEGITLALYLLAATRIVGRPTRETLIPLLAFPIVFWNFGWGQNAFLTAALFGGATLLVDRRPVVAGLLFGAVCYKPHFGLLIPVALAAGRHWRAFAAAAVSSIALVLASVGLFGLQTWRDFFAALSGSHATFEAGFVKLWAFVTPFGAMLLLGANSTLAYGVQIAATLAATVFVGWVWWRKLSLEVRAAALTVATLVAVPLAIFYDLMLAAVAGAWLCRPSQSLPTGQRLLLAAGYIWLLNSVQFSEKTHIPFGLLAVLALLACVVNRALCEARNPAP